MPLERIQTICFMASGICRNVIGGSGSKMKKDWRLKKLRIKKPELEY